jgi:hypothetical protein
MSFRVVTELGCAATDAGRSFTERDGKAWDAHSAHHRAIGASVCIPKIHAEFGLLIPERQSDRPEFRSTGADIYNIRKY